MEYKLVISHKPFINIEFLAHNTVRFSAGSRTYEC